MLDDLITAIDKRYFMQSVLRHVPFVFFTTPYWIDRLHHLILGKLGYRVDMRIHAVYSFVGITNTSRGLNICEQQSAAESRHPLVCKSPVKWLCSHPFLGPLHQVTVAEGNQLRVHALQRRYPDAELDVTMITSRHEYQSQRNTFVPIVYYHSNNMEINTLIRGRDCQSSSSCTTIFVDDYRYERAVLETSSVTVHSFSSILRAISQLYVWIRIILLVFLCYRVRVSEAKYQKKSLVVQLNIVSRTLAKIPSHSIIYSSWFPIIGYSLAHFADCGLTHFVVDTFWSSSNGFVSFDLIKYFQVSSIQMRNIWLLVLVSKGAITFYNRFFTTHKASWQPQQGLMVFRGFFISVASSLTIFMFLRALCFRDTRVLGFYEVQRNRGAGNECLTTHLRKELPDYGYSSDIKSTSVAGIIVVAGVILLCFLSGFSRKTVSRSFLCHTYYVPLSTGVLFPTSALYPLWYMQLNRTQDHQVTSLKPRGQCAVVPLKTESRQQCETCDFISSPLHWRAVQGCCKHETLFDIGQRSVETQSMVRLVHIGVFSDPVVFFQLRVLGKQLYAYRVREFKSRISPSTYPVDTQVFLSPVLLPFQSLHHDGANGNLVEYEFVTSVNSTCVPWIHLVDCG